MPRARIALLGGFRAEVDGVAVPENAWRLRKARELLKLLSLAPDHRLHREQAIDVLWPDAVPDAALNNLHQVVHATRRALGSSAIEVHDGSLLLAAAVDVDEFQQAARDALRAGSPRSLRAALSLYTGELLPENRYDDWASERRDELAELAAELADGLAARGTAATLPPLPGDASSFVGREHELAALDTLLSHTRLLTLSGTGGAGKTRLALELARRIQESYRDGAVLAELAAVSDPAGVVDVVAASIDVRALPGRSLSEAVIDFVSERALLLVLDNCEHVLAASAQLVDALLRAARHLTVIATSREPLRVAGEVVFRVPSLAIARPDEDLDPGRLLQYAAAQLFVDRATAADPGFSLRDANAADVARICHRLDGLPLAIELAAGRVGALAPATIAARLDDRFRLLRAGSRAAPTRQQTLAATLQWSHELLDDDERAVLRRLSAFAGGFYLVAAEAVCAGGDIDAADVADLLARLVEKSLVAVEEEEDSQRRYRLLETVRMFAADRLREAGEAAAVADRHARWALALAERDAELPALDREAANLRAAHATLVEREPQEALLYCAALAPFWLRRIDLAEAQRRFDDALARAPQRTVLRARALLAAATMHFRAGTLARGIALARESLDIARELGDAAAQWRALQFLGDACVANQEGIGAADWLERARELALSEGREGQAAISAYTLGVAAWQRGRLDEAEARLQESADLLEALADSPERVPSPINITEMRLTDPDRPRLRMVFEETLQPFFDISCAAAVGFVQANQAGIARTQGDTARARALLAASSARFEREDDDRGRAAVLVRRAFLELGDGSPQAARECLERALELRRALSDRRGVGLVLAGLGMIDTTTGDFRRAERRLGEARELFRRAGDRWGLASVLWRIADLAFARRRRDDAEAALLEALAVLRETRHHGWLALTKSELAEAALLRDDPERAVELFGQARDHYAVLGDEGGIDATEARLQSARKVGAKDAPVSIAAVQPTKRGNHG